MTRILCDYCERSARYVIQRERIGSIEGERFSALACGHHARLFEKTRRVVGKLPLPRRVRIVGVGGK